MMAAVLSQLPATVLELIDIADPQPGAGEVVVRVSTCGICGTDLHVMAGESYRPELPFVLGHEFAGAVVAAGAGAQDWLGRRVVPTLFTGCGLCPPCRAGDQRLCEAGAKVLGVLGRPGGFAGYVAVVATQLVELPPGVSDEVAASLVDAGATAQNAVRAALAASPYGDARHLVIGAGPVGLLVGELLALAGHPVVVVEPNPRRRSLLAERGLANETSLGQVVGPFTTVVDCSASPDVVTPALELLRPRGLYVAVGYSRAPDFDLSIVARRELVIKGVRSGTRGDLERVLHLVDRGQLAPPPITTWPLAQVNDALSALRQGSVPGKAVVVVRPPQPGDELVGGDR